MEKNELAPADSLQAYRQLMAAINKGKPSDQDLRQLRRLLNGNEALVRRFVGGFLDQAQLVQGNLAACIDKKKWIAYEMLVRQSQVLRQDLGHESASGLEKLLIDHVVTCWLRLHLAELLHTTNAYDSPFSAEREYQERLLSTVQKRS